LTLVSELRSVDRQYTRRVWALFMDRVAFVCLTLLALTFVFEAPIGGLQVGVAALSDSLTTVKILEGLVIATWALSRVFAGTWPDLPRRLILPVTLWLIALIVSTALAPDYLMHTLRFLSRLLLGLLLAWVAYDLVDSPARWQLVIGSLVIAGVSVGLLGLAEAAGLPPVLGFLRLFRDGQTRVGDVIRISASLDYATIMAMVLEMLIPLMGAWLLTARQRWLKAILGAAIVIAIVAMVLTLTRSAILGLAVALLFMGGVGLLNSRREVVWASVGLMVAVVVVIGSLLVVNPTVGLRMLSESEDGWYQARYAAPVEVAARPGEFVNIPIQVNNAGRHFWQAAADPVFRLGYTLTRPGDASFAAQDGIRSPLPADVRPGQTIAIVARVASPPVPGVYLIQWDMVEETVLWFSWRGSAPGSTRLVVAGEPVIHARPPKLGPANHAPAAPPVERPALWGAALRMFRSSPLFGVGPDNFRWVYGRFLNLDHWDTKIHANSIYLETLADTGVIGLLAFLWLNWRWLRLAWQRLKQQDDQALWLWHLALIAALVAWFVHGFLDYFYEFAGTYVLFWLIAGLSINLYSSRSRQQPQTTVDPAG